MPKITPQGAAATTKFVEELRQDVLKAAGDWPHICRLTKGRIGYHWLKAFAYGKIAEPSYTRMTILAHILGKPLFVGRGKRYNQFEVIG